MARRARFCPAGIPSLVIQRGNKRQVCFLVKRGLRPNLHWLMEFIYIFEIEIFGS